MSFQTLDDATCIEDESQLTAYFTAGAKPREQWVVGTEHEKLGWWPDRADYPTYDGDRGIGALLQRLSEVHGWSPIREDGHIIALLRDRASVTLEPGGQLELSGAPLRTLSETEAELDTHLAELRQASEPLGIIWSALGYAPIGTPETAPRMPKPRYAIMRRYLPTRGLWALDMMAMTCSVQANYDYGDETDAFQKLRVSMALQPLVAAMYANSCVGQGRVLPYRSFRTAVWDEVDPDRCLLPDALLEPGAGFAEYVRWAIRVPMFFIHRGGRYLDCAGVPFRDFMEQGFQGHRPTMGDFALHLSTLFPDVRLKQFLEVRGADMASREHVLALPALHKGLLYDPESLQACEGLFEGVTGRQLRRLKRDVSVVGYDARLGNASVAGLLVEVLRLARDGLGRLEPDATRFLDVLDADLAERSCPADRARRSWDGDATRLMLASRMA